MAHIFSQARRKFGFSLIEVIVVVSIIGALSVVAYVAAASFSESRNNSKRMADISTLKGALETMLVETKTLPDPTANRSYYLANGGYAHSQVGAYGVSSSFSEDILGKYALADHPKDPKTGGFYSYGRNFESHPSYDIAAVISENGDNVAYLRGTSNGSMLPSLVKAYDQGGFVEDGKTNFLPYNPYARELIGRIVAHTGAISITPTKALTASLVAGDEVRVNAGGLANIKLSDGSEITLWNPTSDTILKINELKMKDDTGLLTRVRLALASGEMWTQAPKLREFDGNRSDFEVETQGTVAAVRGTIFGVAVGASDATFTLYEGEIQLQNAATSAPLNITGTGSAGSGTIEVLHAASPIAITVGATPGSSLQTTAVTPETKTSIENKLRDANDTITNSTPNIQSYRLDNMLLQVNFTDTGYDLARAQVASGTLTEAHITGTGSASFTLSESPIGKEISITLCKNTVFGSLCSLPYRFTPSVNSSDLISLADLGSKLMTPPSRPTEQGCQDRNPIFCDNPKLIAYAEYDSDLDLRVRSGSLAGNTTGIEIASRERVNGDYIPWVDTTGTFKSTTTCVNISPINTAKIAECATLLWLDEEMRNIVTQDYYAQVNLRRTRLANYGHFSATDYLPLWSQNGLIHIAPTNGAAFTGVYINDSGSGGALFYDGSSFWPLLQDAKWVVLELSVRGSALKQTTWQRQLFVAEGTAGGIMARVNMQATKLTFLTVSGLNLQITVPANAITDSALYIVRATVDPSQPTATTAKLEIIWPGLTPENASLTGSGTFASIGPLSKIYVGSQSLVSNGRQWNDLIDNFRISHP